MRHLYLAILAIIVLAVLISGCSGGSSTGTPCPTPQAVTTTPSPTWSAVDSPARADQLFHLDGLNWYQYRADISTGTANLSSLYKFEYSDETYDGTASKHTRMISNDTLNTLDNIVDIYTSKADGRSLGGSAKSFISGTLRTETAIEAGQGMNYLDKGMAIQACADSKATLTGKGQEKVTVDGTAYTCAKYDYVYQGVTYTAWYTPQAPAPLKVAWVDRNVAGGALMTLELLGWG
jgi:hypothetical protein